MKRGLCVGNLLLFTFYFLLVFRAAKVQFSIFRFPFSVFNEFRRFDAGFGDDLQ